MFFQDRATLTGQAGIFQPLSGADRAPQLLYKIEARFCRVVGWGLCWDSLWIEIDTVLSFFGEDVGQLRHFFVCLFVCLLCALLLLVGAAALATLETLLACTYNWCSVAFAYVLLQTSIGNSR